MRTVKSYLEILEPIRFRDWRFNVESQKDPSGETTQYCYLQVAFFAPDISHATEVGVTVEGSLHKGRKWLLSPHMTEGEIVQTALIAVLAAFEHEVREEFTYKGQAIFGPHFDLELLVAICETGAEKKRAMDFGFGRSGTIEDVEPTDPFRRGSR